MHLVVVVLRGPNTCQGRCRLDEGQYLHFLLSPGHSRGLGSLSGGVGWKGGGARAALYRLMASHFLETCIRPRFVRLKGVCGHC